MQNRNQVFKLELSYKELVSLKIALDLQLHRYATEAPFFDIANCEPDSSIDRMKRMVKTLDNAMHGSHDPKIKSEWL